MTTPIAAPLTPPQLAVLQKPPDAAPLPAPVAPRPQPRTAQAGTTPSGGSSRGRFLDITV
ncbi:MAG TPA: hypothetical protein VN802_20135 [Stellaceae bacterium]|nr:hypothetical protein [Stellaceae bacterium]